jgi:hypothetical protein
MNVDAIVKFCAEECERQHSGELSVFRLYGAWRYMQAYDARPLDIGLILRLGRMVEPVQNQEGFRTCTVSVAGKIRKVTDFYRQIPMLCNALSCGDLSPEEFYKEYEIIHPFVDGNGRTGVLLLNWLNKTLESPREAPDVFDPGFFGDR